MKALKIVTGMGGAALVALGGWMALSNPRQEIYEQYAVKQLTTYLKNEVCEQAPGTLDNLLKRQCSILVDAGRPQIEHIISEKTQRLNFILFSIYQTDLEISPFLPAYHFETVAAFQNFYIYKAEKQ